ncbi:MAG: L-ribulose-5-phosphate 3-epimerase [Limisphaerales bacterium]|jgi:L-ribulose-5-phosphate 3-epimerase
MKRRHFLAHLGHLAAAGAAIPFANAGEFTGRIYKAVKVTMIRGKMPVLDQFKIAQDAGFDGISLFAPDRFDLKESLIALDKTGVRIHNVNNAVHWKVRLSDADAGVQKQAVQALKDTIQFAHDCGADSMLCVNGKVTDEKRENHEQVRTRSLAGIRAALPLAARLGVRILCENVGNGFCPDARQWADYIDEFDTPFVGAFFDIGNHHGYKGAPHWIRTLGKRVVKIDVKDRNLKTDKNCNLFDGDIDWAEVRTALRQIRFNGWATAEVQGGDAARIKQVAQRMDRALSI